MKSEIRSFLLIMITGSLLSCKGGKIVENDLSKENIKGQVKEIKTSEFFAIEKFGELEKGLLTRRQVFKYNKMGYTSEFNDYDQAGNLVNKSLDKYDDKGRLQEFIFENIEFASLYIRQISKYDENGHKIEDNSYNLDGSLSKTIVYTYDTRGNEIESNVHDSTGALSERYAYKYDNSNKLIQQEVFSLDGKLESRQIYKYDENGNTIERDAYYVISNVYEKEVNKYDARNNLIESISPSGKIIRTYVKYDKIGNWIIGTSRLEVKDSALKTLLGSTLKLIEREIAYY